MPITTTNMPLSGFEAFPVVSDAVVIGKGERATFDVISSVSPNSQVLGIHVPEFFDSGFVVRRFIKRAYLDEEDQPRIDTAQAISAVKYWQDGQTAGEYELADKSELTNRGLIDVHEQNPVSSNNIGYPLINLEMVNRGLTAEFTVINPKSKFPNIVVAQVFQYR